MIFNIASGIITVGAVVYLFLGSTDPEPWAFKEPQRMAEEAEETGKLQEAAEKQEQRAPLVDVNDV